MSSWYGNDAHEGSSSQKAALADVAHRVLHVSVPALVLEVLLIIRSTVFPVTRTRWLLNLQLFSFITSQYSCGWQIQSCSFQALRSPARLLGFYKHIRSTHASGVSESASDMPSNTDDPSPPKQGDLANMSNVNSGQTTTETTVQGKATTRNDTKSVAGKTIAGKRTKDKNKRTRKRKESYQSYIYKGITLYNIILDCSALQEHLPAANNSQFSSYCIRTQVYLTEPCWS